MYCIAFLISETLYLFYMLLMIINAAFGSDEIWRAGTFARQLDLNALGLKLELKLVHGGLHDLLEAEGCGPERAEDLDEDSEAELGSALDFASSLVHQSLVQAPHGHPARPLSVWVRAAT